MELARWIDEIGSMYRRGLVMGDLTRWVNVGCRAHYQFRRVYCTRKYLAEKMLLEEGLVDLDVIGIETTCNLNHDSDDNASHVALIAVSVKSISDIKRLARCFPPIVDVKVTRGVIADIKAKYPQTRDTSPPIVDEVTLRELGHVKACWSAKIPDSFEMGALDILVLVYGDGVPSDRSLGRKKSEESVEDVVKVECLEELRNAIGKWSARNFGETTDENRGHMLLRCACGITEELGELQEGIEASEREESADDIFDAVGDICIYALDFMYKAGLSAQDVFSIDEKPTPQELEYLKSSVLLEAGIPSSFFSNECDELMRGLTIQVGRLSHATLKTDQGIRGKEDRRGGMIKALHHIFKLLYFFCRHFDKDTHNVITDTASRVLQRDWVKSPDSADVC